MFRHLYKQYIVVMSSGRDDQKNSHAMESSGVDDDPTLVELGSDAAVDAAATRLGNNYRGIGVAVGILGAAIIFFAVTPTALQLHGFVGEVIGGVEIALMLIMLGFVIYGTKSNLRQQWVKARRRAEFIRYQELRSSIEKLRVSMNADDSNAVLIESMAILDGENGQVAYNSGKHSQYERIEQLSDRAAWIGFSVGLVGAGLHLSSLHAAWLIYLTAFVPALIGAIHGVNSFLQIGSLSEDHRVMADRLLDLLQRFEKTYGRDASAVLQLSEALYGILSNRDVQWVESTEKFGIRPA